MLKILSTPSFGVFEKNPDGEWLAAGPGTMILWPRRRAQILADKNTIRHGSEIPSLIFKFWRQTSTAEIWHGDLFKVDSQIPPNLTAAVAARNEFRLMNRLLHWGHDRYVVKPLDAWDIDRTLTFRPEEDFVLAEHSGTAWIPVDVSPRLNGVPSQVFLHRLERKA